MIALGSDHAGFPLKEKIKDYFDKEGIKYTDFGPSNDEPVDYPIFAVRVANAIVSGECEKGILCCGTGIGISIAANKIKGIRAACCTDEYSVKMTRKHNDANVLALGARVIDSETSYNLIKIFLETEALDEERHQRRIKMLEDIENGNL